MGRLLGGLVLGALLLPYLWFAGQAPAWQATPVDTVADVQPYQLLNYSHGPPILPTPDPGDAGTLMDLPDFRWLQGGAQPRACHVSNTTTPPGLLLLVLIHSAPQNDAKRRRIRETWGAPREGLVLRFFLGLTFPEVQRRLAQEQSQFGDLVQGSFVDAYRNLTYKHVMALKWTTYLCPTATYVLKVDDDVLVDIPSLVDILRTQLSPYGARDLLLCASPFPFALPKRTHRSKWRVSYAEYPHKTYPPYCSGWAVLYSPDVVVRLYQEAQGVPYFWIDDVLVTGVLAGRLGLRLASWATFPAVHDWTGSDWPIPSL